MRALLVLLAAWMMAAMATHAVAAPGPSERRVALVIGNSAYRHFPALPNPRTDALDLAASLRKVGFEVIEGPDLTKGGMATTLQRFARLAAEADAALVFYAGHGLQYQGQNYLVPTDAKLEDEIDLDYETIRVEDVVRALDRARGVRILILDACRNLPLPDRGRRDVFRDQGLAKLGRRGMIVAYATQANEVAYDGNGRNSFFTGALLKEISEPGVEVGQLFRRVQASVSDKTGGRQMPELSLSVATEFYFNRGETDIQAWTQLRNSADIADLQRFVERFPNSFYVEDAKSRISLIQQLAAAQQGAGRRASSEDARGVDKARLARTVQKKVDEEEAAWARLEAEQVRRAREAAERERGEEDQKRVEVAALERQRADDERKRAEEARKREVEERKQAELAAAEARRTEEQRRFTEAAEVRRQDEEHRLAELADQKRQADERKQAERAAAEAKRAEEQRKVAEAAEQKRQAEERRLAELADQKRQAEERKQAERAAVEAKRAEEQRRIAEAAEQKRQAEERRRAELADQKRQADERKQAERVAAEARRAEEQRKVAEAAEQKRQAEERKQAELAQRKREEDERRQAELAAAEARRGEEQRRLAEAAEMKRQDEERKQAELRVAAEAKRADEQRRRIEVAALDPARSIQPVATASPSAQDPEALAWARLEEEQRRRAGGASAASASAGSPGRAATAPFVVAALPEAAPAMPSDPAVASQPPAAVAPPPAIPADSRDLVRQAQKQLARLGCYEGAPDGILDDDLRGVLARYGRLTGGSAPASVTEDLVRELTGRKGRVCPLECADGERARGNRCVAEKPRKAAPAPVASRPRPRPEPVARAERAPRSAPVARAPRPAAPVAAAPAQQAGSRGAVMGVGF
jgi:uncharacterized caspase-like protein